ncbi:hypothetical protein GALMADRAFT_151711 [Galerina marginata CBS 339.88]|uniref:DUF6534 domain-containing protein n=1 Tax=Galerina marginata (strain CBS 339.88) TaxID=685588 RepID=A0A067TUI2_GALM3|nr:hypothetical protein GALMADRAFT_151711 [Galerina marginata CBS 339.88]
MRIIETNLGPVLLGVFFNTYLYGIVTFQYSAYLSTKFRDPLWVKAIVVALFFLDTFHTSSLIYMAWYYLIENYANYLALLSPVWPYPSSMFVTAITALLTHLFLAYRTLRLTNIYVYGGLVLLSLCSFSTGLVCSVKTLAVKDATQMSSANPYLSSWLSLEVIADAFISGTLIYALRQSRTGFEKSDTVINRLMRTSIQTGLFSGVFSILTLAFFLGRPDTQMFAFFGLPISRLYTNTLMDTLLCREGLRGLLRQVETSATCTNRSIQLMVHREVHTDSKSERPASIYPLHNTSSLLPVESND